MIDYCECIDKQKLIGKQTEKLKQQAELIKQLAKVVECEITRYGWNESSGVLAQNARMAFKAYEQWKKEQP